MKIIAKIFWVVNYYVYIYSIIKNKQIMPYISKEQVAAKRKAIKAAFPEYKISVRNINYSKIDASILAGPIALTEKTNGYEQVNQFYIKDNYKDRPETAQVLQGIVDILKADQTELTYDGDYGSVPTFYVGLSIGDWDKPYQVK